MKTIFNQTFINLFKVTVYTNKEYAPLKNYTPILTQANPNVHHYHHPQLISLGENVQYVQSADEESFINPSSNFKQLSSTFQNNQSTKMVLTKTIIILIHSITQFSINSEMQMENFIKN
jgi:hypothetical protein